MTKIGLCDRAHRENNSQIISLKNFVLVLSPEIIGKNNMR